jgi:hypothetical protein
LIKNTQHDVEKHRLEVDDVSQETEELKKSLDINEFHLLEVVLFN